jgi:membrane associated rhomboid family serine protease
LEFGTSLELGATAAGPTQDPGATSQATYFSCTSLLVEEEEGSFAVWLSYLVTGVGANVVSWLVLPRSVVSAGASGAVFGLFAVSVLVKVCHSTH